jgi:hypothetical protein
MNTRAESLARALGGHKAGSQWMARCPAHEDGTPSLAITQAAARVLVHCFAGCTQDRVLAVLRQRGLWCADRETPPPPRRKPPPPPPSDSALSLWRASLPARGTIVETYLASRGLSLPQQGDALRFHPRLWHQYGRCCGPAMVALVRHGRSGAEQAIHRTLLKHDGSGKATLAPPRMSLGPRKQGAIHLTPAGETLLVGEGIETCLSALQATGLPTWSALCAEGIVALELPPQVRTVIVLADGDEPGEQAALRAARRWQKEGRIARIARPPSGMDFNDVLKDRRGRVHD